jgi:hypothetical protein
MTKKINNHYHTYDNFGRVINAEQLGMAYTPVSESCFSLEVDVPDSMGFETHEAIKRINKNTGGNTVQFVADRLNYSSTTELCSALASEQIDAVALAIYNIEAYRQGMIIGDQTGIGKGRQAAAIIRYAVEQGLQPIFLTEKPNLFSDIYRDLIAIGSGHLVPFIVNAKESKTQVKDEDGKILFEALELNQQNAILEKMSLPAKYNFVLATYSQFNQPDRKPTKPNFLRAIADNNILIFDEAHNASGSSNTGQFLKEVVVNSQGVLFLSATFAKRPDNMPIYALKTAISEANMSSEDLTDAIVRGGVALQEVLASQLVKEAQMLRRERTYEGIEVNYITLTDLEKQHRETSDKITGIIREIIKFQKTHIEKTVDELDSIASAKNSEVEKRKGTASAGVDNLPYFSKVFNVINQMLFSIKADAVADRAIMRLKQGKKPVIAFASTMESFLNDLGIAEGESINADFSVVLEKGLEAVLKITTRSSSGEATYTLINPVDVSSECHADYLDIKRQIKEVSTGISISPIDIIKDKLISAGYTVAEVTGRKSELQINPRTMQAIVVPRKKINTNDAFRKFNNNEVDVLMINQAGSTGASAHAIPTKTVPKEKVQQRVMIVLQPELDINREVQKRGRINRTGQIIKPIYDYMSSAIPAEQRLMMMLQRKLKSLDANTTSNQKNSSSILSVPDFLNKIGDAVVVEYLLENKEINKLIDDPLHLLSSNNDGEKADDETKEDAASRVSGRIAILSTTMQKKFYDEIITGYNDQVDYLKQIGEYDLEVETLDLKARLIKQDIVIVGKGGRSQFGTNSYLQLVDANVLKKPYSKAEVEKMISEVLKSKSPATLMSEISEDFENFTANKLKQDISDLKLSYEKEKEDVKNRKKITALKNTVERKKAIDEAVAELENAIVQELQLTEKQNKNKFDYLFNFLNFFYTGRGLNYPISDYENGMVNTPCVCLGVIIDKKRPNPYAPSSIKFRFALSDSNKYVTLVASGEQGKKLNDIIASSVSLNSTDADKILTRWTELCSSSNVNRKNRYIVSGNILQAFSVYKGSLVAYTTDTNNVAKGILMPENWLPTGSKENFVTVPIIQALNSILKLQDGRDINTSNGIAIRKNYNDTYTILVPGSQVKGGSIYKDKDIFSLTNENNFNLVSGFMKGTISIKNIKSFVEILQNKHNVNVALHSSVLDSSGADFETSHERKDIMLKPHKVTPLTNANQDELLMFELEAMALELELELLNL